MELSDIIKGIGLAIDVAGVLVIVVAIAVAGIVFVQRIRRDEPFEATYQLLRRSIGRGVLLGLELLVAGDIIRTVAIEPDLSSVAVLGLIVLVRTFLSFSLEVELTGRWPWNRGNRAPMETDA